MADHYRGEALASMTSIVCDAAGGSGRSSKELSAAAGGIASGLDYTPILVSVLLAVLILVVGYLVAFTFRNTIKDWMFRASGGKAGSTGAGGSSLYAKDKLFDVFISYALEDAEWVEANFAPSLEHGATSYRLCLHQRDFPPTTPLADTVSVAVESSTRAVVVLSRAYVSAAWAHIRAAFMEAVRANNTKVVFIQLDEEVELAGAGELRHLAEDSPVVRWADPGFWNKLRYFLPEPVYLTFHRNVTMRGTLQASNLYQPVLGGPGQPDPAALAINSSAAAAAAACLPAGVLQSSPSKSVSVDQPYQPTIGSQYGSEHTYHSIDNNHIYHTLDPGGVTSNSNLFIHFHGSGGGGSVAMPQTATTAGGSSFIGLPPQHAANNRVFINQNLDVSMAQPQVQHPPTTLQHHHQHRNTLHAPASLRREHHQPQANAASPPPPSIRPLPPMDHHAPPPPRPSSAVVHSRSASSGHQSPSVAVSSAGGGAMVSHGRSHSQSINHAHTNSTSSAKKLLSGEEGEYIV